MAMTFFVSYIIWLCLYSEKGPGNLCFVYYMAVFVLCKGPWHFLFHIICIIWQCLYSAKGHDIFFNSILLYGCVCTLQRAMTFFVSHNTAMYIICKWLWIFLDSNVWICIITANGHHILFSMAILLRCKGSWHRLFHIYIWLFI